MAQDGQGLRALSLYFLTIFYGFNKTKNKWQICLDISLIKPIFDAKVMWLSTGRKHYPGLMVLMVEQSSWYSNPLSHANLSQKTSYGEFKMLRQRLKCHPWRVTRIWRKSLLSCSSSDLCYVKKPEISLDKYQERVLNHFLYNSLGLGLKFSTSYFFRSLYIKIPRRSGF